MLSKNKIKYIHSLSNKKRRNADNVYVAEGPKIVADILIRQRAKTLIATEEWLEANATLSQRSDETICITEEELHKISQQPSPQKVLGVFSQQHPVIEAADIAKKLVLALDGVQDPGNLGTIIRIADWFGIDTIVCSQDTVDVYNPKVIQATMGSIARVNVVYTSLCSFIEALPPYYPVYATLLDGKDIYQTQLAEYGMIVMGNEGNGISAEVKAVISNKLLIPTFATSVDKADSLNVAIATAIVCSEFRRKTTSLSSR